MKKDDNFIFGSRPVIEALKSGRDLEKVLIQRGMKTESFTELMGLLKNSPVPYQFVPAPKLHRITRKNHQGVIAFVSEITYQKIEDVLPMIFERGEVPFLLFLDRITDVRNFGAIARSAECAGIHAIVIPQKGGAQINADAVKTSAGALHKIAVCREENLQDSLKLVRESGVKVIAASEKGDMNYFEAGMREPLALLLGSEEDGVSDSLLRLSDAIVKIPLKGSIDSLNVSVACGILAFEAVRQRM